MVNSEKITSFFKRHWHWLAFFILAAASLSFLFGKGLYNFTDSGYYSPNSQIAKSYFVSKLGLFSNTDGFSFGYDNSQRSFAALFITFYQFILTSLFGATMSQIVFYFLYYLVTFVFGRKLLRTIFKDASENAVVTGALFLTFNPVSLLLITLGSVGLTYAMFIVFCYAVLKYLQVGKYRFLLLSLPSGIYLFYYLRFLPLFVLLFISFIWLLWSRKNEFLRFGRVFRLSALFLLCASPFIVGNALSFFTGSSVLNGYQNGFQQFEEINYNFKSNFLFSLSYPGGFTPSVLSHYFNPDGRVGLDAAGNTSEIYKVLQIVFNVILIGYSILLLSSFDNENRKKVATLIGLTLFTIGINTIGYFTSLEYFGKINHSVLAFLYNDYGFIQLCQSFFLTFLLVLVMDEHAKRGGGIRIKIVVGVVLGFCLLNTAPYLLNRSFYGLQKVSSIPEEYRRIFLDKSMTTGYETSVFIPYYWLKLSWTSHFINLNFLNDSRYRSLIVPNFRVAGSEFITLYNDVYNYLADESLHNLAIFNVKSLFLLKDVEDADTSIDAYGVRDKANKITSYSTQLAQRKDAALVQSTQNILHYRFSDADRYDFLLYSPQTIVNVPVSTFFDQSVDVTHGAVFVDEADDALPKEDGSGVFYKWGVNNPNKYYAEVDLASPTKKEILIQLDQMQSKGWSVYQASQNEFESIECKDETGVKQITRNKSCYYTSWPLHLQDLSFLFRKPLPAKNTAGNYFGNLFTIPKDSISPASDNKVYLVFFFRGQSYYELSLLICFTTLSLVACFFLAEEAVRLRKKE